MNEKSKTACFSGYCPDKIPDGGVESANSTQALLSELYDSITASIADGYNTFLVGMTDGFDMMAAEEVIKQKATHDIKIIPIIPFDDGRERSDRFNNILAHADDTVTLSDTYSKGAYVQRNEYMVDSAKLRAKLKKETQFNRKMELNIEIKKLEQKRHTERRKNDNDNT